MLAFLMIVSIVACDNTPDEPSETTGDPETTVPEETTTEEATTEEPTTDDGKMSAPEYNGVFKTGYARADITPSESQLPLGEFTKVNNPVYATCVAVNDGDKTVILVSVDQKSISADHCDEIRDRIKGVTGIAVDNIFISATHNHAITPFATNNTNNNTKNWSKGSFVKIAAAAKNAINDLADTEIFIGRANSSGMAFVRRYVTSFGLMSSVIPADNSVKSVRKPDEDIQIIRFARKDKKDIIMTNWQAHLADAVDKDKDAISADMAHFIREDIEAGNEDALVVYFAGASANINLTPARKGLRKYEDYIAVAKAFAEKVLGVINSEDKLTKVQAGKITVTKEVFAADHKDDSAEEIAAARARLESDKLNPDARSVLKQAADRYLVARNERDFTNLKIAAISFGDIAFTTVPYEMFDNNGVEIKDGSRFKMTFILTNSDGDYAYMPAIEACGEDGYGGYETEATYFEVGVAEKLVERYVAMLNAHKGIS